MRRSLADAALPVRAPPLSQHILRFAARDAARALSRAIAERLIAGLRQQRPPPDIAMILETARENVRAAEYWNRAAQGAARLYAHDETARLAQRGLALLRDEPDTPERAAVELGSADDARPGDQDQPGLRGRRRRRGLRAGARVAPQVEDPKRVVPVLIGMSAHHIVSGEIRIAHEIALEMQALFERLGDPHLQMIGEWSLGAALFHLGELKAAHEHLGQGARRSTIRPSTARACGRRASSRASSAAASTVADADAARLSRSGLAAGAPAVARRARPRSPAAAGLRAAVRDLRPPGPPLAARGPADLRSAGRRLPRARHRAGNVLGGAARGRAFIELGDSKRGLRVIEEGIAAHTMTRSALLRPYYFMLLAGALLRAGTSIAPSRRSTSRRASRTPPASMPTMPSTRGCRRRSMAPPARPTTPKVSRALEISRRPGRALARAPRLARLRAPPRPPPRRRSARAAAPILRGSPKAATRWTTSTLRGLSRRWNRKRL